MHPSLIPNSVNKLVIHKKNVDRVCSEIDKGLSKCKSHKNHYTKLNYLWLDRVLDYLTEINIASLCHNYLITGKS